MEIKLSFAANGPPISVIAVAKLAGVSLPTENSGCALTFHFSNGSVDSYLEKRTFVVGDCFSIADIAIWSALAGTGQRWESLRKSKRSKNPVKWFNSVATEYSDSLNEVTAMYFGAFTICTRTEWLSSHWALRSSTIKSVLCPEGKVYVDDTPCEQMQKERMDGIESKSRSNSVEEIVDGNDFGI
ncbi:hypothetical protein Patl1_06965 [Pistacia atlantica]|uniref:Uncharacterized protein n=1 Tax=Pistacia atlantica TaxID=434234 RepID=A0ACC1AJK6_9ROSI|nr:hypothetical protein Patl1_06965 [Pistacia atlantica]